jgi:ATP-dependent helicase/nuclease subunit B
MSGPERRHPRVFTIPAGAPFLDTLADAFLSGALFDASAPLPPEDIAETTIYLPTRRACQALMAALGARSRGPMLLPRIRPLGDVGADGVLDGPAPRPDDLLRKPPISPLDRRFQLLKLVDGWRRAVMDRRVEAGEGEPYFVAQSRADAFALAGDLAALIDEAIVEGVPLARLAAGPTGDYDKARHDDWWWLTSRFVEIVAARWPEALADQERGDEAEEGVRRLMAEAARLSDPACGERVVVAGSTGSVPATALLMRAVAGLTRGAVILPGLDQWLPADAWTMICHETSEAPTRFGHPQCILKQTLQTIGVERMAVRSLAEAIEGRSRLVAEIFRPAESSEAWAGERPPAPEGLALIEAADTGEEALAIAFILREALETPGRTAALVTPDRQLACAVQFELERWGVDVADSAGQSLDRAPSGAFARLVLRAASPDAGGGDLIAVLRHPLAFPDAPEGAVDAIELAALRGRRLNGGATGLAAAMDSIAEAGARSRHDPAPARRLTPEDLAVGRDLAHRLADALHDLTARLIPGDALFRDAAATHRAAVEAIAGTRSDPGAEALSMLFEEIARADGDGPPVGFDDYLSLFDMLTGDVVLPPSEALHPRLKIWGLLEARLLEADRIILAGLDEGVWPPAARGDPFLNRAMRTDLGLHPPERRIGQSAHDFQMLLGHRDVVLTRSRKRDGAPAIASRFLRRLTAWLGAAAAEGIEARGARYLDWARQADRPLSVRPAARPAPRVAPSLLPPRLSITEIETLYRDPYAIFARRILGLDALEPIDPPLDARERGALMHQALADFARDELEDSDAGAIARLIALGDKAFAGLGAEDAVAAEFWRRRFSAYAPQFVEWHRGRLPELKRLYVETPGALALDDPGGWSLRLSGRADRIEELKEGGLAIIDYKTGDPPSEKEAHAGYAPQLPLTAAMAARGAFREFAPSPASALLHVKVAGARGEGKVAPLKPPAPLSTSEFAERQFDLLRRTLASYGRGGRGFVPRARPRRGGFAGDYDLLARHLEWSLGGGDDAEDQS